MFVSRRILEIGVSSAVINFSDGARPLITVMKHLKMIPGKYMKMLCHRYNTGRIKTMTDKSSKKTKDRRKKLRATRKGFIDKEKEDESETYKGGEF